MEILVTHRIRDRELDGGIPDEARKLFDKLKQAPAIATPLPAKGLPSHTSLHKVYATTGRGPRRLLFFCRHTPAKPGEPERWVLLFYRDKSDSVGKNMSHKNPDFARQLNTRLREALTDLAESTPEAPKYEII
jgi:hypothetical protein